MFYNDDFTGKILRAAIEVHKNLGPGLLESLYEKAMCFELKRNNIKYENQVIIPVLYKNIKIGEHRIDLLINNSVIIELKAVDKINKLHKAQLLSYLKLTNIKTGLLINFNVPYLKEGIIRIVNNL